MGSEWAKSWAEWDAVLSKDWEEHLLPQGGAEPLGSSSEEGVGHFSVCAGVSEEFDDADQIL